MDTKILLGLIRTYQKNKSARQDHPAVSNLYQVLQQLSAPPKKHSSVLLEEDRQMALQPFKLLKPFYEYPVKADYACYPIRNYLLICARQYVVAGHDLSELIVALDLLNQHNMLTEDNFNVLIQKDSEQFSLRTMPKEYDWKQDQTSSFFSALIQLNEKNLLTQENFNGLKECCALLERHKVRTYENFINGVFYLQNANILTPENRDALLYTSANQPNLVARAICILHQRDALNGASRAAISISVDRCKALLMFDRYFPKSEETFLLNQLLSHANSLDLIKACCYLKKFNLLTPENQLFLLEQNNISAISLMLRQCWLKTPFAGLTQEQWITKVSQLNDTDPVAKEDSSTDPLAPSMSSSFSFFQSTDLTSTSTASFTKAPTPLSQEN